MSAQNGKDAKKESKAERRAKMRKGCAGNIDVLTVSHRDPSSPNDVTKDTTKLMMNRLNKRKMLQLLGRFLDIIFSILFSFLFSIFSPFFFLQSFGSVPKSTPKN